MRFFLGGLAILAAIAFLVFFWLGSDEPSRLALANCSGEKDQGALLGVSVGDSWHQADAALRHKFKPSYVVWHTGSFVNEGGSGRHYSRTPVLLGDAEVSYGDSSWRNGAVTLRVRDGHVIAISWHYRGMLCCVDF